MEKQTRRIVSSTAPQLNRTASRVALDEGSCSPINQELHYHDALIADLTCAIEELQKRLEPVLCSVGRGSLTEDANQTQDANVPIHINAPETGSSSYALHLASQAGLLQGLAKKIRSFIESLEI